MNEIRKAEIFNFMIEEGYTSMINFYVLNNDGRRAFIQSFGGKKFHTHQDCEIWKNGIENITNRRLEDSKGAVIKTIITDDEEVLGIGNLNESYWIVKEKDEKTVFKFKTTKKEIDEFFEKNNVEHRAEENKDKLCMCKEFRD